MELDTKKITTKHKEIFIKIDRMFLDDEDNAIFYISSIIEHTRKPYLRSVIFT